MKYLFFAVVLFIAIAVCSLLDAVGFINAQRAVQPGFNLRIALYALLGFLGAGIAYMVYVFCMGQIGINLTFAQVILWYVMTMLVTGILSKDYQNFSAIDFLFITLAVFSTFVVILRHPGA
jgi:hypothetical protein